MKKPDVITYFMGLPSVGILLLAGCAGFTLAVITKHQEGPIIFVPFVIAALTIRTMVRVSRYRRWKRDWDAMNGIVVDPKKGKGWRNFISWLIMLGLLYAIPRSANPKLWDLFALLLAVVTVISLLTLIGKRLWAHVKAPRPQKELKQSKAQKAPTIEEMEQEKMHFVSMCQSSPRSSPKIGDMYAQLPDYCRAALASSVPVK